MGQSFRVCIKVVLKKIARYISSIFFKHKQDKKMKISVKTGTKGTVAWIVRDKNGKIKSGGKTKFSTSDKNVNKKTEK